MMDSVGVVWVMSGLVCMGPEETWRCVMEWLETRSGNTDTVRHILYIVSVDGIMDVVWTGW